MRRSVISGWMAFGLAACAGGEPMDAGAGSAGVGESGDADGTGDGSDDGDDQGQDAGGDSDADDDSGAESEGGESCNQAQFDFELEPQTPNVMLILDKSRSMSNLWDHDADPTTPDISRWHSLHNVVTFLTDTFSADMNFGAQLFPSATAYLDEPTNAFSCLVEAEPEVAVGAMTGAAIDAAMPSADDFSISGGTPASAALVSGVKHLNREAPDGPRAIVLLTDGAANCSDGVAADVTLFEYDPGVPETVDQAFTLHQIPVYVVGINILDEMGTKPAVNPYEALTDVAIAGGVPAPGIDPFYNAFNEVELEDALNEVIGAIECTITLEQEPDFPQEVQVSLAGASYDPVTDCEGEDGFVYTSPAGPYNAIQLCGAACNALQGGGTVTVDYTCP